MGRIEIGPETGVIVTGGASGIGRACALALAEVDRPVSIWDLDAERSAEAAREIAKTTGVTIHSLAADVRETASFSGWLEETHEALGSLGGLVHCAGVSHPVPVDGLAEEDWDLVLGVNLRAQAFLVREMIPYLVRQPGSAIVGIASINAILGNAANPAYGASKAGVLGLTRSLADRLGSEGVRVNAVCPGYIDTPMLAPAFEAAPELRERMEATSMLGRLAEPREVAKAVRFLMSDEASFVTAEHLVVDGGVVRSQR
jgi:NAD(P)-dependent dehydrogenase (short-subunit alcohol dehydrogenase family)